MWIAALALAASACGQDDDPSDCESGPEAPQCRPVPDADDEELLDSGSDDAATEELVTLEVHGGGVVEYRIEGGPAAYCFDECTIPAVAGDAVDFEAGPHAAFAGWAGVDCVGPHCHIQVAEPVILVASFDQPTGWSDVIPLGRLAADFDAADALNVAGIQGGNAALVHYDTGGQLLWQTALPGAAAARILGVDADSTNSVYVFVERGTASTLHKVAVDGTLEWTEDIAGGSNDEGGFADLLAVTANDEIAVLFSSVGGTSLRVFDAGAQEIGSATGLRFARALAARPTGDLLVAFEDEVDPERTEVDVFTTSGIALGSPDRLPGQYRTHLTVDATGAAVASTSGHGDVYVSRSGADGFTLVTEEVSSSWTDSGVAVDASGNVIAARALNGDDSFSGALVEVLSPSGQVLDTIVRPPVFADGDRVSGLQPTGIAADGRGRFALVGDALNEVGVFGSIELFEP